MLSIGKLAAGPGTGRYYVDQVAQGREDYYGGEGEAPGNWIGTGTAQLGVAGLVEDEELLHLLSGRHPRSGKALGRPLKSGDVAGFDLTFRAPKSVSILFGIGDEELAAQVRDGHEAAVGEALGYLEREACVVRRGRGGAVQLPGNGFVAAAFRHRASRAGEPLLHTHVVVANAALGPDGRWTALFGRRLYAEAKTAGYLYQAALRNELTERLGLGWEPVSNGTADVRGIPRELIEHFATRRHEILAAMASRGEHSPRAAQVATLATRRGKTVVAVADQREQWRLAARAHRVNVRTLDDARALSPGPIREPLAELEVRDHLLGEHGLTVSRSSFDRGAVLQGLADASRGGDRVDVLEARADVLLADPRVIPLDDGRWSTREHVELERGLLRSAQERHEEPATPVAPEEVQRAAAERSLSDEQTAMVEQLVLGDGGVQVVRAAAGAGKTFALDAARAAWQSADVPVLGCALSARAACELRDQAVIDATTIARLRMALNEGAQLQPGSVLIVDEAGMVGTRDLAALVDAASQSGTRLILVGDDRQLPEIAAGGAFAELARRGPTAELHEVHRQKHQWDRAALSALRNGDIEAFVDGYAQHDRIVALPNAQAAREQLVEDWWQATQDDKQTLMLAHRRADVADLNQRARARMRDADQLGPDQLECHERSFAIGDHVIATRNDRQLNVHNGQAGVLTAIEPGLLSVQLSDGRELVLPAGYAEAGHLDHGYALTAHRAQGATVDATFVLGSEELSREWGYTALSRHREEAHFYISARPTFVNEPAPALTAPEDVSLEVLRALSNSRVEQLAAPRAAEQRADAVERAEGRLRDAELRLADLEEPTRAGFLRRRTRAGLDERAGRAHEDLAAANESVANLIYDAALPQLVTAHDPLTGLKLPPAPQLDCGPDLATTPETGLDLGP